MSGSNGGAARANGDRQPAERLDHEELEIGRASCRERV